jgi:hypothetical protein
LSRSPWESARIPHLAQILQGELGLGNQLLQRHQPVRIPIRQGAKEHPIHDTEHGRNVYFGGRTGHRGIAGGVLGRGIPRYSGGAGHGLAA